MITDIEEKLSDLKKAILRTQAELLRAMDTIKEQGKQIEKLQQERGCSIGALSIDERTVYAGNMADE